MLPKSLIIFALSAIYSTAAFAQQGGFGGGGFTASPGTDLSGNWSPAQHDELVGNPAIAEYYGVPINENARAFGLAWSPSRATVPEHQCQVHLVGYIYGGPLNLRIWEEKDPQSQKVVAIKQYISTYEQNRTIWMDGRPHPSPNAPHTWMGFSTGKWEGDMLTVYTTHMKTGELRRNGLLESDEATLVEHFMRYGNYLTHVAIITDPLTLTEPFVREQTFTLTVPRGRTGSIPVSMSMNWPIARAATFPITCRARTRLSANMPARSTSRWRLRWVVRHPCIPTSGRTSKKDLSHPW
jgi:hypothetical protein